MKFYKSPLFAAALFLIGSGIYFQISSLSDSRRWDDIVALLAFIYGGGAMLIHLIVWLFLKKKPNILLIVEFLIILAAMLLFTRSNL